MTRRSAVALAVCALLLAAVPWIIGNEFYVNMASQVLIYALFALSINMMLGYGGMVSLGHAGYLGIAGYACILATVAGYDQLTAAIFAIALSTAAAAFFGVLSLRAPGLGFIMITLALGQIVWGVAYRANDLTGGDNGIRYPARPMPFGFDIRDAPSFYYFTLIVFAIALFFIWRFSRSPFGASLMGARDQPRRMRMLGHNVWLIRWITFVMAGFWASVAGVLYVYYNLFLSPHAISLQQSAEILLMAILGGASTLTGPIVGARNHHASEERSLDLCRALEHAARRHLRGRDRVHAVWSGPGLHAGVAAIAKPHQGPQGGGRRRLGAGAMTTPALEVAHLSKRFGGLPATKDVSLSVMPGERRLIIGPNGAGKTTLFNLVTGDLTADAGSVRLFGQELMGMPTQQRVHLGLARTYQILTLFPRERLVHNVVLSLLGLDRRRWNPWSILTANRDLYANAQASLERVGLGEAAERIVVETSYGERRRLELAMALAQKPKLLLLDEPLAGLSQAERQTVRALLDAIPRDVTIVMIEHDMDTALGFAERITVLHYGEVIVEGTRAEVVADPRTREVYLGD